MTCNMAHRAEAVLVFHECGVGRSRSLRPLRSEVRSHLERAAQLLGQPLIGAAFIKLAVVVKIVVKGDFALHM